jgi:hypothetical protein
LYAFVVNRGGLSNNLGNKVLTIKSYKLDSVKDLKIKKLISKQIEPPIKIFLKSILFLNKINKNKGNKNMEVGFIEIPR